MSYGLFLYFFSFQIHRTSPPQPNNLSLIIYLIIKHNNTHKQSISRESYMGILIRPSEYAIRFDDADKLIKPLK